MTSRWLPPALLVASAIAVFANSLGAVFVYDDHSAIVQNPNLRSLWPLAQSLAAPPDTPAAGRPLVSLSLALDHAIHGLDPRSFHATNLLLHLLGALALYALVARALRLPAFGGRFERASRGLGLAVALLWLVHPVQTEVVSYAIQRSESLASLCYLLTMLCALRAGERPAWGAAAVAACAAGMASKESVVTAPLAVVLFDLSYRVRPWGEVARARAPLWLALGATWLVLGALLASGPRAGSVGTGLGISPFVWALNQVESVLRYLRLAVWPTGLVLDYGVPRQLAFPDVWVDAAALAALAGGALALFLARPRVGFPAIFFFLALAPTSSVVPIATEVAAERRMHLALAGPLALVVPVSYLALRHALGARAVPAGAVLVALLAGAFGLLSRARTLEYASEAAIWRTVAERAPGNWRGHYNLGTALAARGELAEAERSYRRALALEPGHLLSRYNLGVVLGMQGRSEQAIRELETALRIDPGDPAAHQSLGILLEGRGLPGEAAAHYRRALEREPERAGAAVRLAWILATSEQAELRDAREAVRLAERANAATGGADPSVLGVLAAAQAASGRFDEALGSVTRAVELAERARAPELAERLRAERARYAQGLPLELRSRAAPSYDRAPEERPAPGP